MKIQCQYKSRNGTSASLVIVSCDLQGQEPGVRQLPSSAEPSHVHCQLSSQPLTGNNSCHLHLTSGLYLMDTIFLFSGVNVRVQMLYQQGFDVKEGLVRFEAGSLTGRGTPSSTCSVVSRISVAASDFQA